MRRMNVIAVFSPNGREILLCRRKKPPYQGLLNLVGGKLESGEGGLTGAYRELFEETGIAENDIGLAHLMDFIYYVEGIVMEVYYGRLLHDVVLREEVTIRCSGWMQIRTIPIPENLPAVGIWAILWA